MKRRCPLLLSTSGGCELQMGSQELLELSSSLNCQWKITQARVVKVGALCFVYLPVYDVCKG